MNRLSTILSLAVLIALWELVAVLAQTPILPDPIEVTKVFIADLPVSLGWHMLVSSWRMLLSMGLAVIAAVPLGLALGQSRRVHRFVSPFLYVTYPIPKIVFLPVIMLFLGIGDVSKVFIITLILFYQVLVVVRDASSEVRAELVHSIRSLGANRWQLIRYVYFPACIPATLTALRISTGTAIAVLYIAESFATRAGLGFYIMDTWQALAYPRMYSAVIAMSLIGLLIYISLDQLEKKTCAWVQAGH